MTFAESAPEFDLFGYIIPVLPCDERAATWSMKLPPIRFPELQKVKIAVYRNEENLFEYNESKQVIFLNDSKRKSIIDGSYRPNSSQAQIHFNITSNLLGSAIHEF